MPSTLHGLCELGLQSFYLSVYPPFLRKLTVIIFRYIRKAKHWWQKVMASDTVWEGPPWAMFISGPCTFKDTEQRHWYSGKIQNLGWWQRKWDKMRYLTQWAGAVSGSFLGLVHLPRTWHCRAWCPTYKIAELAWLWRFNWTEGCSSSVLLLSVSGNDPSPVLILKMFRSHFDFILAQEPPDHPCQVLNPGEGL